jgi:hypothetical protein
MHYTDYCVGTCKTLYFWDLKVGSLALKHVEILYFMYELQSFVFICWFLQLIQHNVRSMKSPIYSAFLDSVCLSDIGNVILQSTYRAEDVNDI